MMATASQLKRLRTMLHKLPHKDDQVLMIVHKNVQNMKDKEIKIDGENHNRLVKSTVRMGDNQYLTPILETITGYSLQYDKVDSYIKKLITDIE